MTNAKFTPVALKIVPVTYQDGTVQLSICDDHDNQICLIDIGMEKHASKLAAAPEMYEWLEKIASGEIGVVNAIYKDEINKVLKKARGE